MTEKILLELGIDINNAEVTLEQLQKQLKEANKEFSKAAVGSKAYADAAVKVKALDQAVKTVKGSAKDARNSLGGINEAAKTTAGSMEDLEQQIKGARKELYQMVLGSKEYEDQLKKVNDLEAKRVGFRMKEKSLFQERVAAGTKEGGGGGFSFGGIGGMVGKAGVYGAAIAGLGALAVEAVDFLGLDQIQDKLDNAMTAVKVFFKNIGTAAYNELGRVAEIMNQFFSGNFAAANVLVKQLGNDMSKAFDNAIEQSKEAMAIQQKLNDLEDEEKKLMANTQKAVADLSDARVKALRKTGDNQEENIQLAIKEAELARETAKKELKLMKEKIDLTKALIAAENKGVRKEMSDKQRDKLLDLEIKYNQKRIEINSATGAVIEKLSDREQKIRDKEAADKQKKAEADQKRATEDVQAKEKAAEEKARIDAETLRLEDENMKRRISLIGDRRERELQQLALDAKMQQDAINKSVADQKTKDEALLLLNEKYLMDRHELMVKYNNEDAQYYEQLEQMKINNIANEQERSQAMLEFEFEREREKIRNTVANEELKYQLLDELEKKYQTESTNRTIQTEQAKRDAVFATINSTIDGLTALGSLLEKNGEFTQAMTLFKIGANMAEAISSAIAAASANPANSVTFGAAGAAQFAASAAQIAVGIAQAKAVLTEPPKGFNVGGHTGNTGMGYGYDYQGNEVAGIVHTNEMVFNAKQANDLQKTMGAVKAMLSSNSMGKGINDRIEVNIVDIAKVSTNSSRVREAAKL